MYRYPKRHTHEDADEIRKGGGRRWEGRLAAPAPLAVVVEDEASMVVVVAVTVLGFYKKSMLEGIRRRTRGPSGGGRLWAVSESVGSR